MNIGKRKIKIDLSEDQAEWLMDCLDRICGMKNAPDPAKCNLLEADFVFADEIIAVVERSAGKR